MSITKQQLQEKQSELRAEVKRLRTAGQVDAADDLDADADALDPIIDEAPDEDKIPGTCSAPNRDCANYKYGHCCRRAQRPDDDDADEWYDRKRDERDGL